MIFSAPYRMNEPIAKHTTWRIGGPAKYMVFPETLEHLEAIAKYLLESGEAYAILGNGSNLLASDDGFDGVMIKTSRLPTFTRFMGDNKAHVGASTLNAKVVRSCAEKGLAGLEFLAGIPGTIGGAIWMNAGTDEGCIADIITEVRSYCLREGLKTYSRDQIQYSYRKQHFIKPSEIIIEGFFQLKKEDSQKIKERIQMATKRRKDSQPVEMPSCGSVFKNPKSKKAWQLIDAAGLRGTTSGGAKISEKHANFIINTGNAKMSDVLFLIKLVKEAVEHSSGIVLEEEVVILQPLYLRDTL